MSDAERLAVEIAASTATRMAFGIPGGGASLVLIDALERRDIPFHLTHFEGAAALMAAAAGRLAGAPGLSISIKGPGLANSLPGITAAHLEAFPLVHFSEAYPAGAPQTLAHKRLDQRALAGPVVKGIGGWSASFAQAHALAIAEEPGPVLVELVSDAPLRHPEPIDGAVVADERAAAERLLASARQPIVIAGALATRAGLGPLLARVGCPVFTTAAAKGLIDEASPHAAGVFTGVGLEHTPEAKLLPRADLVVGIGLTARECLTTRPFLAPLLAVEAIETPGTAGFAPAARIPLAAVDAVLETVCACAPWGLDETAAATAVLYRRLTEGFLPGAAFAAIERRFDRRARIVLDTGNFCTVGEHVVRARSDRLFMLSGQGRNMGTSLPMAIGAALQDRSVPTVAVLGDGGAPMFAAEMRLAVRQRLPLLVVVMSDGGFGSILPRAIEGALTRRPLTSDGGFVELFAGCGAPGTRVFSAGALEDALAAWAPESGPAVVEIVFDRDLYARMVDGVR